MRAIEKRFGQIVALDHVDFVVRPGSVHALLGENGAGKTTPMRIVYGLVATDAGDVDLFGAPLRSHSVRAAMRAGVGMVHQHLSLVPPLTATENLALGGRGQFRPDAAATVLREVSRSSGLSVRHDAVVRDLSIVEQQRLEILKALARDARLLILDEPTAILAPTEVDDLLQWIRSFAAGGGSVVLVTHKLREALAVADDVTVLRRGRVVHTGSAKTTNEQTLGRAMFPEHVDSESVRATQPLGEVVVRAVSVDVTDARGVRRVRGATFTVHRHEILGIAAIEGSGHRELLRVLTGQTDLASGTLQLPGDVAIIPADRARDALVPEFTLTENVALHQLAARRGLMPWRALAERTLRLMERFGIRAPSPSVRARVLSGGNQQRLVVARELEHDVDLIVADNPTRGLDIRATAFVHEQLRAAAAAGSAVIVHSSDLDELLALATRIIVVFHGDVRDVAMNRDEIGRAMLGVA